MKTVAEMEKGWIADRERFDALEKAGPPKPAPVGPPTFDSAALKMAIRFRHKAQGAVIIDELLTSTGPQGGRYIDMWAIRPNPDKGCLATSYEIKVSRADFLRDLKQPLKQRGARLISDQFYFVAPPGILKPDEIPDWSGLLELDPSWGADPWGHWAEGDLPWLHAVVPAPMRSKDTPSWPLVVSLLRREAIVIPIDVEA